MDIKVVIVDDDIIQAKIVENAVNSFESKKNETNVRYKIIEICKGNHAFEKVKDYIQKFQKDIDILFVDYNLDNNHLGTEVFKLLKKDFRIYKVLHSQTDISFVQAQKQFINKEYNIFSVSKDSEYIHKSQKDVFSIHKVLEYFDEEIITTKLTGNKIFKDKYFDVRGKLRKDANNRIIASFPVTYFQALYIESNGNDNYTLFYYDNDSKKIQSIPKTKLGLESFLRTPLEFKQVSRRLVINLLWVSKIDILNNVIEFIRPDNQKFSISFIPDKYFDEDVKPHIKEIEENIHPFFKE